MAVNKKNLKKVFISLGKVKEKVDGKEVEVEKFCVVTEDFAKYVGATYSVKPPAPIKVKITKGKLAGKTIEREHSTSITGDIYSIGYIDGVTKGTGNGKKAKSKIKWVPLHIPRGVKLRAFVSLIMTKFKKKPAYLKTPNGTSVPLSASK
jgi:hypothetical protein